jgi:hypothetical protein
MTPERYPMMGPQSDVLAVDPTSSDGGKDGDRRALDVRRGTQASKRRSRQKLRRLDDGAPRREKSCCQSVKAAQSARGLAMHNSGEIGREEKITRSTYVVQ